VVVPVDYCAVRDLCEFFNQTTYAHVWKVSVLVAACLLVSSWHSHSSEELLNRRPGYQKKKKIDFIHLDMTLYRDRVAAG